jgi:hypothetical protein
MSVIIGAMLTLLVAKDIFNLLTLSAAGLLAVSLFFYVRLLRKEKRS